MLSRTSQSLLILISLLLLTYFVSAKAKRIGHKLEQTAEDKQLDKNVLVKVKLPNGSQVEFIEPEDGILFVVGDVDEDAAQLMEDNDEEEQDEGRFLKNGNDSGNGHGNGNGNGNGNGKKKQKASKLYKRLACDKKNGCKNEKQKQELALIEAAEARVQAKAEEYDDDEPLPPEEPEEEEATGTDPDASEEIENEGDRKLLSSYYFERYYCRLYGKQSDWCRCYTGYTATTNNEVFNFVYDAEDIQVWLHPYRGEASHVVRWWGADRVCDPIYDCSWSWLPGVGCSYAGESCYYRWSWKHFETDNVSQLKYGYIGSFNDRHFKWKMSIFNAKGDGFHWSTRGNMKQCCDPEDQPGRNGIPICIEGSSCCPTGWECNYHNGHPSCGSQTGKICDADAYHTCPLVY